jgi:hypothetical protein
MDSLKTPKKPQDFRNQLRARRFTAFSELFEPSLKIMATHVNFCFAPHLTWDYYILDNFFFPQLMILDITIVSHK